MPETFARPILIVSAVVLAAGLSMPPTAAAQGDAKRGAQVYAAQKCQSCHAIGGQGMKANPLDGVGKKLSAADIREWIMHPVEMAKKSSSTKKPPMQDRYSKLPPADIDALVAYMQSLK
jgi:mono/diheme cytochrome c family protein